MIKNKVYLADKDLGLIGGPPDSGLGPFSDAGAFDGLGSVGDLSRIISTVIGIMTIVAGLWFIFNFMIAAVGMVVSAGNEEAVKNSTKKMTQSLVGLVIVIGAFTLISLISLILGIDFLDLEGLIGNLW